jgi:hypothetical protein
MTTKHTPGPWAVLRRVDAIVDNLIVRSDGVPRIGEEGFRDRVAEATWLDSDEETEANARLIAAAPDLLAAAEAALEILDEDGIGNGPTGAMLAAAIAKARGGTP